MFAFLRKNLFADDFKGSVAVEFAMLAIPFFMMIMGIIEVGLFFGSAVVLEGAATEGARLIRTGQAQTSGDPVGAFEDILCQKAGVMIDCSKIQYEVINIPDRKFTSVQNYQPTYDEDGNLISAGFDAGESNDIILVRIAYRYEFLTPLLGRLMETTDSTNSAFLMSNVVIMNEPYEFGD